MGIRFDALFRRLATILAVSLLTLTLIAAVTGILLAFYYGPTAGGAFSSMQRIMTEVPFGWLIRGLHDIAGNGAIALALLQLVAMFLAERSGWGWFTAWISGILLTLSAIALSWTAMILDWSQIGYWRFAIELGTIGAIPLVGPLLRDILTGGEGISTVTVQHLYALHSYLLAIAALLLAVIHLLGLLFQERRARLQMAAAAVTAPESPTKPSEPSASSEPQPPASFGDASGWGQLS